VIAPANASVHAHGVLKRYTPFADNSVMAVYFASAAQTYEIRFKGLTTNSFSSPSFYLSPFTPFSEFPSIREGTFSFTEDPDQHGEDVRKTLRQQVVRNWKKLPRLVYENFVFLSFGHCWPPASSDGATGDKICLWERWIWLPLILVSLLGSLVYLARRRAEFVPLVALGFIFSCFVLAQVAPMEGRYRMPLEPVMVLTTVWLWERRRCPRPN
jgi:hypothetical protein